MDLETSICSATAHKERRFLKKICFPICETTERVIFRSWSESISISVFLTINVPSRPHQHSTNVCYRALYDMRNAASRIALIQKNLHLNSRLNIVFHREKRGQSDGNEKNLQSKFFWQAFDFRRNVVCLSNTRTVLILSWISQKSFSVKLISDSGVILWAKVHLYMFVRHPVCPRACTRTCDRACRSAGSHKHTVCMIDRN